MKYEKVLLCGLRCVGKSTLFWNLQKELDWPVFSLSQYLRDYIRSNGLQGRSEEEIKQHWDTMTREIDERIVALLKGPNQVIIETRAFHFIRDRWPGTITVLLTASDECRAQRSSYREGINLQKATKRLVKREGEWMEKMKDLYGFGDFFSDAYYDLVVDTTNLNKEQVLGRVVRAVRGEIG